MPSGPERLAAANRAGPAARAPESRTPAAPEPPWHAVPAEEAMRALDTGPGGLGEDEAARRASAFGPNRLPQRRRAGPLRVFVRQFGDPLIYILLAAAVASVGMGDAGDAVFILAVLLLNAAIGGYQEWKAETGAEALRRIVRVRAVVERGGARREVDGEDLVPGDVVHVGSGVAVPADVRLVAARELRVDESLLTGESVPVAKRADAAVDAGAGLGDRATMLHAGSVVLAGRGTGVVCRTGGRTELGGVALSLGGAEQAPPLVLRLRAFSRRVAVVVVATAALLGCVLLLRGEAPAQVLLLAVALAVSAIPEGLPVAITVALSVASNRMARRNVIVRLLPAVEGLGACTLVASDKTGTLTANRLTVARLWVPGLGEVEAGGSPAGAAAAPVRGLAATGALCNEATLHRATDGSVAATGDTVDAAFLVWADGMGLGREALLPRHPQFGAIAYEAERRYAASFNRHDGRVLAHVKGAADAVLPMCGGADAAAVRRAETGLAQQGYRVLALASGEVGEDAARRGDPAALARLRFLGLAGLIDPIRPEVPEAVARCRAAGVDVRIVTGDHPATGLAIARRLGLASDADRGVTGAELAAAGDGRARAGLVHGARVFARVEPAQKTEIVQALQGAGHFVAVTGDGVNDAPALRAAHIGVAMGRSGSDVARGAADLVLADDNFASIVAGIEEGRVAYDNVRKVVWMAVATGAAEILLIALAVLLGLPLPLTAVQLLWLNLVTNGLQDVALAFERGEPGVLDRPPRPPDEPLFDRRMVEQTVLAGATIGGVGFAAFWWMVEVAAMPVEEARNLLLLLMVLFENLQVLGSRSETRSVFRVPLAANPFVVIAVVAAQAVHVMAMHAPGLSGVLEIAPVAPAAWLSLLPLAASVVLVGEAYKRLRRRRPVPGGG
ncbi:HAD-IC family P-type ATPase [Craurococcus roseus]|uniref:HAD-IC family P-type ATPase n=1 Tax=Craurococcus roseus TaxID=77585 RepID=A0ABP3RFJ9_9PROT